MTTVRKIVIKNFKPIPEITEEFTKQEWKKLESAITSIQNSTPCELSFEELYRVVDNLCTYNCNHVLTQNLYNMIQEYLTTELTRLVPDSVNLLTNVANLWVKFQEQTKIIKNIFLKYDRLMCNNKHNMIWSVSLSFFKSCIVLNPLIKNQLMGHILQDISSERNKQTIDRDLMKAIMSMFVDLQIYEDTFLPEFLEETRKFYKSIGDVPVVTNPAKTYLKIINNYINEEHERVDNYLAKQTEGVLMEILNKFLIADNIKLIFKKCFVDSVEKIDIDCLSLLYDLVTRVSSGQKCLEESFSEYLLQYGTFVLNPNNDKTMIKSLLDMKDKVDNIVVKSFRNNESLQKIVRNCFVQFINKRPNKPAELLAKYIDQNLRCKERSEDDLDEIIDKVMVIFRFVQGKDIFEAFYKKDLAKRLLLGKSTSQDAENNMLSRLKQECGSVFTSKLEGMFKDITISQSLNATFKQYLNHMQNSGDITHTTDLSINVLTSSYWPSYPTYDVTLPQELVHYQILFQKFYTTNHSGRKLTWQPNLGHCIIKARFKNTNKELQVSLFQAIVLLLFNDFTRITYNVIKEGTNLSEIELKRTLQSLACGKTRVLIKEPKGKEIMGTDVFIFNEDFDNKLYRVKINEVQHKETSEEQKATEESVLHDRQFQIDAAVVRIMKQKKSLSHNALLSELFSVLDIPMKPCDLKKRIELLIEREYIERDRERPTFYNYVAFAPLASLLDAQDNATHA